MKFEAYHRLIEIIVGEMEKMKKDNIGYWVHKDKTTHKKFAAIRIVRMIQQDKRLKIVWSQKIADAITEAISEKKKGGSK